MKVISGFIQLDYSEGEKEIFRDQTHSSSLFEKKRKKRKNKL